MYVRTGLSGYGAYSLTRGPLSRRGMGAWNVQPQVGQNYPGVNPNSRTNPNPPDQVYWFDTAAFFRAAGADPKDITDWIAIAKGPSPVPWPSCKGFNESGPNPYMDSAGRIKYWKAFDGTVILYDPTDPLNYCPEAALQVRTGNLYNTPNPAAGWAAATAEGIILPDTYGIGVQGAQGNQLMAAHLMDIFPYSQPCFNSQCPHSFTGNTVDFSNMLWVDPSTGDNYIGDWRVPLGYVGRLYGSMADYTAAQTAYSMMDGDVQAIAAYGHTTSGAGAPNMYALPPSIPNTTGPNHYDVSAYGNLPPGMSLSQVASSAVTVPNYQLLIAQMGAGAKFPVPPPSGSVVPYTAAPSMPRTPPPPPAPVQPPAALPPGTGYLYFDGQPVGGTTPTTPVQYVPPPAAPPPTAADNTAGMTTSGNAGGPSPFVSSSSASYVPPPAVDSSGNPISAPSASSAASGMMDAATSWVSANPLMAAGIAVAVAVMFMSGAGGRR